MTNTLTPVEAFFTDVRASNSLRRGGYEILEDVLKASPDDLLRIPNFGYRSLHHIELALAHVGLTLNDGTCPNCGAKRKHQRYPYHPTGPAT